MISQKGSKELWSLHQLRKILHSYADFLAELNLGRGAAEEARCIAVIAGSVATSQLSCYDWHVWNFQLKLHFAYLAVHDASVYSHTVMHFILIYVKMHTYLAIRPTKPHIRMIIHNLSRHKKRKAP